MTPDKIIVIVVGVLGIIFTYWFFLMKKYKEVSAEKGEADILVDGGYTPEAITILKGKVTTLNFVRKDPSACLEEVVIGDLKIRKFLPLNKKVSIDVKPENAGEIPFSCGMNIFHGKLIVK